MSSADPRPRRPAWVYLLAVALPLGLVAALLVPLGVSGLWRRLHAFDPVAPGAAAVDGSRGVGDRYYPNAGNGGYDVSRYQIAVTWDPSTERLSGATTITARAQQSLHSFSLDLQLDVAHVTVDGQEAGLAREAEDDWRVTPAHPVVEGRDFSVVVEYGGTPGRVSASDGSHPWSSRGQEWLVAGEPESAAWWFPSDDHPSDPALMDVSVRVPRGLQVVSNGRLASADTAQENDWDTWHWVSGRPMATYLAFLAIGRFTLEQGTVDGLPYVYAVSDQLPAADRSRALAVLRTTPAKLRVLSSLFGPYPFTEIGGIVPAVAVPFDGLEAQTRPVYRAEAILTRDHADELLAHELAHMWFGDNVTVARWDDIFDNEAYASWAAWAWRERSGGLSAEDRLRRTFAREQHDPGLWAVTMSDPGRDDLFTAVYVRGPMALQALRNVMGDEAFTRLNVGWAQEPGSRSLEDWMARAQSLTPTDLGPFFAAWISGTRVPARTAANGLA